MPEYLFFAAIWHVTHACTAQLLVGITALHQNDMYCIRMIFLYQRIHLDAHSAENKADEIE